MTQTLITIKVKKKEIMNLKGQKSFFRETINLPKRADVIKTYWKLKHTDKYTNEKKKKRKKRKKIKKKENSGEQVQKKKRKESKERKI